MSSANLPPLFDLSAGAARQTGGARRLLASCVASKAVHLAAAGAIYALVASDLVSFSPPAGRQSIELAASFAAAEPPAATFQSPADEPAPRDSAPQPQAVPIVPRGERPPADGQGESPPPPEQPPSAPREEPPARRPALTAATESTATPPSETLTKTVARPALFTNTEAEPAPASIASQAAVGAKVDSLPAADFCPEPVYPPALLAAKIEGVVVVRLAVGSDGSVTSAAVHRTSGHAAMDDAALAAVRQWKFQPARRFGSPIAVEVLKPLRFRIETP
ncbi:MAG: TonB family protein [Pirellulaceae bacterium]|nr:TonB family protein [Pirellulaceae bacterium]